MKRVVTIMGTLLIAAVILISGSAVAGTWHYAVSVYDSGDCMNPDNALDDPDGDYVSLGIDGPPTRLGKIILDLGSGNGMPTNTLFTVYAGSTVKEEYRLILHSNDFPSPGYISSSWWTGKDDTTDEDFTTPSITSPRTWHYIEIQSEAGGGYDPYWGSEIDAVGWEEI